MEGIRLHPESVAVASGRPERRSHAPLNPPIVLSAMFHHGSGDNPYLRDSGSETTQAFETAIGALEGGTALAYSSGMAAINAVLDDLPTGSVVVAPVACYNGASLAFDAQERLGRLVVRRVDVTATEDVIAALPGAALLWLESPTNPLMGIVDTPVVTAAAHAASTVVCLDSTFTTPLLFRPLEH
ncbi:MAG: PLP-dependent transferase, partial [Chloroflexi bacterium]|nr:PLP-dependent transferase [Chloroflexota bacterium]